MLLVTPGSSSEHGWTVLSRCMGLFIRMATICTWTIPGLLIPIPSESIHAETLLATGIRTNLRWAMGSCFHVVRCSRSTFQTRFQTEQPQMVSTHEDRSLAGMSAWMGRLTDFLRRGQLLQGWIVPAPSEPRLGASMRPAKLPELAIPPTNASTTTDCHRRRSSARNRSQTAATPSCPA